MATELSFPQNDMYAFFLVVCLFHGPLRKLYFGWIARISWKLLILHLKYLSFKTSNDNDDCHIKLEVPSGLLKSFSRGRMSRILRINHFPLNEWSR